MNMRCLWIDGARAIAAFFGLFTLGNLAREVVADSALDLNIWWIGAHGLPPAAMAALLCGSGLLLMAFASKPAMRPWRKWPTSACVTILMALASADAIGFWALEHQHRIFPRIAVPLSLVIVLGLGCVFTAIWRGATLTPNPSPSRGEGDRRRPAMLGIVCVLGLLFILFPLAQMFFFGKTDYRRRADCAVVFGARAYADGTPSQALADRVRTACALYRDGWVHTLVFSGGPGDGEVHETESMRRMALRLGVPNQAIVLDKEGLNTRSTVVQTRGIFERLHAHRVIAVSHFYHLPRVKLAYQQAGIDVFTVPARETYTLTKMPLLMAREVAAWWAYWAS